MRSITNVPPEWGATDAERAAATKAYVDSSWAESQPFPWAWFGDRILTPRTKAEVKPATGAPVEIRSLDLREGAPEIFVDLDASAPLVWTSFRNADGKVEATSDVVILRPAYPNGILLFEIPNSGRRLISAWFDNSSIQGSVSM